MAIKTIGALKKEFRQQMSELGYKLTISMDNNRLFFRHEQSKQKLDLRSSKSANFRIIHRLYSDFYFGDAKKLIIESIRFIKELNKMDDTQGLIIAPTEKNKHIMVEVAKDLGLLKVEEEILNWKKYFNSTEGCYVNKEDIEKLREVADSFEQVYQGIDEIKEKHSSSQFLDINLKYTFRGLSFSYYFYGEKSKFDFDYLNKDDCFFLFSEEKVDTKEKGIKQALVETFEKKHKKNRIEYAMQTPSYHYNRFYRTLPISDSRKVREALFKAFLKTYSPHQLEDELAKKPKYIAKSIEVDTFGPSNGTIFSLLGMNFVVFKNGTVHSVITEDKKEAEKKVCHYVQEFIKEVIIKGSEGYLETFCEKLEENQELKNNWINEKKFSSVRYYEANVNVKQTNAYLKRELLMYTWLDKIFIAFEDRILAHFSINEYKEAAKEYQKIMLTLTNEKVEERVKQFFQEVEEKENIHS